MIHERFIELIHREIDGLNSRAESQALRDYLEGHDEARKLFDDLTRLEECLGRVEDAEAPADLRSSVLEAIEARRSSNVHPMRHGSGETRPGRGTIMAKQNTSTAGGMKFAVLAAAVIAAVALVAYFGIIDRAPEEEVAGTIGAVEKYRAEQITEEDVILGGDQEPTAEPVPFADLLADAGTLNNLSVQLEAISKDLESRKGLDAEAVGTALVQLRNVDLVLAGRATQVQQVAGEEIAMQLAAMERGLGAQAKALDAGVASDIDMQLAAIRRQLESHAVGISGGGVAGIQMQLGAISRSLEAKAKALDAAGLGDLQMQLGAMRKELEARSAVAIQPQGIPEIEMRLAAISRSLEAQAKALDAAVAGEIQMQLGAMRKQLEARRQGGLDHRMAMELQAKLGAVSRDLGSQARAIGPGAMNEIQVQIGSLGARLEQRSAVALQPEAIPDIQMRLGAISKSLDAQIKAMDPAVAGDIQMRLGMISKGLESRAYRIEPAALSDLQVKLEAARRELEARTSLGARLEMRKQLDNIKMELEASSRLEARAANDLRARLDNFAIQLQASGRPFSTEIAQVHLSELVLQAKAVEGLRQDIGQVTATLGSNAKLAGPQLGGLTASLGAASRDLRARAETLEAKSLGQMRAYFDAAMLEAKRMESMRRDVPGLSQRLQARSELDSRTMAGLSQALATLETTVGSRAEAVSRQVGGDIQMQLGAVNRFLGMRAELGKGTASSIRDFLGHMRKGLDNQAAAIDGAGLARVQAALGAANRGLEARTGGGGGDL